MNRWSDSQRVSVFNEQFRWSLGLGQLCEKRVLTSGCRPIGDQFDCSHQLARNQWIGEREKEYEYQLLAGLYQYYSFFYWFRQWHLRITSVLMMTFANRWRDNQGKHLLWNPLPFAHWLKLKLMNSGLRRYFESCAATTDIDFSSLTRLETGLLKNVRCKHDFFSAILTAIDYYIMSSK